jgi:hypothetical protein
MFFAFSDGEEPRMAVFRRALLRKSTPPAQFIALTATLDVRHIVDALCNSTNSSSGEG